MHYMSYMVDGVSCNMYISLPLYTDSYLYMRTLHRICSNVHSPCNRFACALYLSLSFVYSGFIVRGQIANVAFSLAHNGLQRHLLFFRCERLSDLSVEESSTENENTQGF